MTINTKAIRAAAEAATRGPWETTCNHPGSVMTKGGKPIATCSMQGGLIDMQANVNHIAISNPTAVIALLDRLEAAEKELQLVRNAALDEAAKHCEELAGIWLTYSQADVTAIDIRSLKS